MFKIRGIKTESFNFQRCNRLGHSKTPDSRCRTKRVVCTSEPYIPDINDEPTRTRLQLSLPPPPLPDSALCISECFHPLWTSVFHSTLAEPVALDLQIQDSRIKYFHKSMCWEQKFLKLSKNNSQTPECLRAFWTFKSCLKSAKKVIS